jgi:hypothetical protein
MHMDIVPSMATLTPSIITAVSPDEVLIKTV